MEDWNWAITFYGHHRSIFNNCDIGLQSNSVKKTQCKGIGKRVVYFLLVLIELFSLCVTARRYERISVQNRPFRSKAEGPVDPKFQVEGVAPTNHSSSQKTRLNDLSYGIKIWLDLSFVLSQCSRFTDRRTDRQNSHRYNRVCIPCSAVKM